MENEEFHLDSFDFNLSLVNCYMLLKKVPMSEIFTPEKVMKDEHYTIGSLDATDFFAFYYVKMSEPDFDPIKKEKLQRMGIGRCRNPKVDDVIELIKLEYELHPGLTSKQILTYKKFIKLGDEVKPFHYHIGNVDMYDWYRRARKEYGRGCFSEEQVEELKKLGFDVGKTVRRGRRVIDFDSAIELLEEEMAATGLSCDEIAVVKREWVDGRLKASYHEIKNWNAGIWLSNQREKFKRHKLTNSEVEKLLELGLTFRVKLNFGHALELIDAHLAENPGLTINDIAKQQKDSDKNCVINGFDLCYYLLNKRMQYKKGILPAEQYEELAKRGFNFVVKVPIEEGVQRLKKKMEEDPTFTITGRRKGVDGWDYKSWVSRAQQKLNAGELSPFQEILLESVGIFKTGDPIENEAALPAEEESPEEVEVDENETEVDDTEKPLPPKKDDFGK